MPLVIFRIVWKIPRKSRLETRINSTKNKGEGRNEFPDVKGIDTTFRIFPRGEKGRNEFPDVKGIDTHNIAVCVFVPFSRNEFPDVKGIDTRMRFLTSSSLPRRNEFPDVKGIDTLWPEEKSVKYA